MKKYTSGIELNGSTVSETIGKEIVPFDHARVSTLLGKFSPFTPYVALAAIALIGVPVVLREAGLSTTAALILPAPALMWMCSLVAQANKEWRVARLFKGRRDAPPAVHIVRDPVVHAAQQVSKSLNDLGKAFNNSRQYLLSRNGLVEERE